MSKAALFRYKGGLAPNAAAMGYMAVAYMAGLWLITAPPLLANILGTLLLAHGLVIAAYFIHDFAHGAIFTKTVHNDLGGKVCAWITGAGFASYAGLKEKHLRHHADRLDVVTFSYRDFLQRQPRWVEKAVLAMEWAYIPAVELLMHGFVIVAQFTRFGEERKQRALVMLASRAVFFAILACIALKALFFYAVAYILFLHVLRFMDAFQHTFDVYESKSLDAAPPELVRDRAYEQANTYSNLISVSHPILDLLTLNFAYHNAHHARPAVPWHDLPSLHEKLYGPDRTQVLPASTLFTSWHKNRLRRVTDPDYGFVAPVGDRAAQFVGAVGVSFLTAV
ncbi:MAG TPA: fatty acid desaturase [Acidocella sp.]|jgi:fatty acid desaturase|nr:fatty acid desaturase [Acidocella sp.]